MSEQTAHGLPISTIFLIPMAPKPLPFISKAVLIDRLHHFAANLFVTYRLDSVQLPLHWLTQQLGTTGCDQADYDQLRDYLRDDCGLQACYLIKRNHIPVAWDDDNKTVLYLTEGMARPYTFEAADWLTEEQLAEYTPAFQAAA